MATYLKKAVIVTISLLSCRSQAARLRQRVGVEKAAEVDINYAAFASTHRPALKANSVEYAMRRRLFEDSLRQVQEHNSRPDEQWVASINKFSDFTRAEKMRMRGLVRRFKNARGSAFPLEGSINSRKYTGGDTGGLTINDGPAVRDQAGCGSCWAFASVEVIEGILIFNSTNRRTAVKQFSPQKLVDCAPNLEECGGTGGCDGATFDVAYDYIALHGLPTEEAFPYVAVDQECTDPSLAAARTSVAIGGHVTLHNQYDAVLNILTERGPVGTGIAAEEFLSYQSGIFSCTVRDVVVDHAVMIKGFGVDNGVKYWLVQNSWGVWWGERGHIRIARRDDEETYCGWDYKPMDGFQCKGDTESRVRVCGSCGMLTTVSQPIDITVTGNVDK